MWGKRLGDGGSQAPLQLAPEVSTEFVVIIGPAKKKIKTQKSIIDLDF